MLALSAALVGPALAGLANNRYHQDEPNDKQQSATLCRGNPSAKHIPSSSLLAYWLLGRSDVGSPAVWLEDSIESLTSRSRTSRSRTNVALVPAAQTVDIIVAPNGQEIYSPDPVSINVGDTVRWTFAQVGHDVVSGPS